MGGIIMVCGLIGLAVYVYGSLTLQTIAKKTHTENAWWAWIPILHAILMLNIAKKPLWWFLLFLVPLVNIVILIIFWMAIADSRRNPSWWAIFLFVPLVSIIFPAY